MNCKMLIGLEIRMMNQLNCL